jgi:hypothetical protein
MNLLFWTTALQCARLNRELEVTGVSYPQELDLYALPGHIGNTSHFNIPAFGIITYLLLANCLQVTISRWSSLGTFGSTRQSIPVRVILVSQAQPI